MPMTTLKEALKNKKLPQFIKERQAEQQQGDKGKFDSTLSSMVGGKKKSVPASSLPAASEHCDDIQTPRRKKKDA